MNFQESFVSSLLTEMKCWMPWPHRLHFEVARLKKHRAWEVSDLLLLLLYCHIPPSRGMEIRTLEIVKKQELDNPFSTSQFQDHNILSSWNLQGWWPSTSSCTKTTRFTGHKQIDLQVGQVIAGLNLSQNLTSDSLVSFFTCNLPCSLHPFQVDRELCRLIH